MISAEARGLVLSDLRKLRDGCLKKAAARKEEMGKGVSVEHAGLLYSDYEQIHEAYGIGAITEPTFRRLAVELEAKQAELEKGRTRWDDEAEALGDIIWSLENLRPVSEKGDVEL